MRINNTSKIPNTIMRELTHHDRRVRKKLSGKLLSLFRKQLSHSGKKCDLLELRRLVSEFIQQRLHFQSARSLLRQLRHQLGCAALATALKQADTQEFKDYQQQVVKNAKALEEQFKAKGYKLVSFI